MDVADAAQGRGVFRNRAFVFFLLQSALANFALQMQSVAVGWSIYALTGSPTDLGLAGLVEFLPTLLLSLATGHVADRYDRRRILFWTLLVQTVSSACLLALALAGNRQPLWIFCIIALFGVTRAFRMPTTAALLPRLVPEAQFQTAVAWRSTVNQLALIAGPALGGVLYILGPANAFAVVVVMLLLAALAVALIRVDVPGAVGAEAGWQAMLAGVRFVASRRALLGAVSLDLFAVLLGGATALLPVVAHDVLHAGPWALGLLRCAPGLGAVAVAFALARRPLARNAGRTMFVAVAIFGICTILFGLSRDLMLSMAVLAVAGGADMISVFVRQTLVQIATPDAMRGRVSAISFIFIGMSNQIGEFESGVTAGWLGTVPAIVLGGIGTLLVVGVWAWRFPELRQVNRLDDEYPAGVADAAAAD